MSGHSPISTRFVREWDIGGYTVEAPYNDAESWFLWRKEDMKYVSRQLLAEMRAVLEQCKSVILQHAGDAIQRENRATYLSLFFQELSINACGHGKSGDPTKPSEIILIGENTSRDFRYTLYVQDDTPIFNHQQTDIVPTLEDATTLNNGNGNGLNLITQKCRVRIRQINVPKQNGKYVVYQWGYPSSTE